MVSILETSEPFVKVASAEACVDDVEEVSVP